MASALLVAGVGSARAQSGESTPSPPPSPSGAAGISAVPLFAQIAADGTSLQAYTVPIHVTARIHKFIFGFRFRRDGVVSFHEPDQLSVVIRSVPKRYADVFAQLGTPRTWPLIYNLQLRQRTFVDGRETFELNGVPLVASAVEHVVIRVSDDSQPIEAQWVLQGGWTVSSTIELESVANYLLPKSESADITGHGFKIHSDMVYGDYALHGDHVLATPSPIGAVSWADEKSDGVF